MKKLSYLLLAGTMFSVTNASAKVNLDRLRSIDENGWFNETSIDFDLNRGNTDDQKLDARTRFDYQTDGLNIFGIIGATIKEQNGDEYQNNKYAHIRLTKEINETLDFEVYAQREMDKALLLDARDQIGSGIVWKAYKNKTDDKDVSLKIGTGLLWQNEVFEPVASASDNDSFRSSSYVAYGRKINKNTYLTARVTYDASLEDSKDYRIESNVALGFNVFEDVYYVASAEHRYDNDPAPGLDKEDLELKNGFKIFF